MSFSINLSRKKLSFIFSVLSCFIAHGFFLFNSYYMNNVDCYVLFGASVHPRSGRYIGYILQKLTEGMGFYTVIKPANILISFIFIALISMILIETFDIKNKICVLLFALLFPLQPCIIQIMGFQFVAHFDFFAEFLMALATYYIIKNKNLILSILFIVISLGIYQAYLPLAVMMVFGYIFIMLISNEQYVEMLKIIIRSIISYLIGILIYIIGNNIFLRINNITMYNNNGFGENVVSDIGIIGYFGRIVKTYVHFIEVILGKYGNICNFPLLSYFLVALLVLILIKIFASKMILNKNKILLIIMILLSPIIFDFSYIMSGISPARVQTSLFFIVLFPIIVFDKIDGDLVINTLEKVTVNVREETKNILYVILTKINYLYKNIIIWVVIVFICMFTFISIGEHYNLYVVNKDFERNVNYIVNTIYNHPDYKDGMRIITVGNYHQMRNEGSIKDTRFFKIHERPNISNITWQYSMEQYFKLYGSIIVEWAATEEEAEKYKDMPCFPNDGCMKKINDNDFIIKFS